MLGCPVCWRKGTEDEDVGRMCWSFLPSNLHCSGRLVEMNGNGHRQLQVSSEDQRLPNKDHSTYEHEEGRFNRTQATNLDQLAEEQCAKDFGWKRRPYWVHLLKRSPRSVKRYIYGKKHKEHLHFGFDIVLLYVVDALSTSARKAKLVGYIYHYEVSKYSRKFNSKFTPKSKPKWMVFETHAHKELNIARLKMLINKARMRDVWNDEEQRFIRL